MPRGISQVALDTIKNDTKKREIRHKTEVKDEPVKKKTKLTNRKADLNAEKEEDEEPADPNAMGLSEYEKKVQANIAERMKLFDSLEIAKDRDELKALTPSSKKKSRNSSGISGRGPGRPKGTIGTPKVLKPEAPSSHTMKIRRL